MRRITLLISAAILVISGSRVLGQVGAAPTTVQLPTFHVFTVQTTVSVPDRGGLALGGISRGADGRVMLGPLGNRATASNRGAGGVSATATIIDNQDIDQAILASGRATVPDAASVKANAIAAQVKASATAPPAGSVAAIRQQNAEKAEQKNRELAQLYASAERAEASGKQALARAYYGMVARQGSGELKQHAEKRLAALTEKSAAYAGRR